VDAARQQAHELIHQSNQLLNAEAVGAKSQLAGAADQLADQIAQTLLKRTAA
jgi:F0F1-type ATP synthase membrane subunit b/b'